MTRSWGASGVIQLPMYVLPEATKKHIARQIRSKHQETHDLTPFFEAIETSVQIYRAHKTFAENSRPGAVRSNLNRAMSAALALNQALDDLDANSALILQEVGGDTRQIQNNDLPKLITAVTAALDSANQYPAAGRLPAHQDAELALNVAKAVAQHLSKTPTATEDGLYESVLAIALKAASGKEVSSVHRIAQKGLEAMRLEDES